MVTPSMLKIGQSTGLCDIGANLKDQRFQMVLRDPFVSTQQSQRSSVPTRILIPNRNQHTTPGKGSILTIQELALSIAEMMRSRIRSHDRKCLIPKWNRKRSLTRLTTKMDSKNPLIPWTLHKKWRWAFFMIWRFRIEIVYNAIELTGARMRASGAARG